MIDKIGYFSEIDVIGSLSPSLGRGSGRSDRETEGSYGFRDVLASEMNSERGTPATMEKQESPLPASSMKPDRAKEGEQVRSESGSAPDQDSSQPQTQTSISAKDEAREEKDEQPYGSNKETGDVPARTSQDQGGSIGARHRLNDAHREDKEAYITRVNTQTLSEKDDEQESAQGKPDECVVDVLGISPAGLPVAAQVVVDLHEQDRAFGENGQTSESDAKHAEKSTVHGELQRRVVRGGFETTTIVNEAEKTNDSLPVKEISDEADSGDFHAAVTSMAREPTRRLRGDSNEEPRGRKNVAPPQMENNESPAIAVKRPTAEQTTDDASPSISNRAINPSQILPNDRDNRSRESIEQLKQDSNVPMRSDERFRAEGPSIEHARDPSSTHHVSRFAERTEHFVTIQRVAQAIRLAHEHNGEIRLRLYPPELGALKLQMRVQEGTLTARLEVETPAAREVLLDNLPSLRERLAEHNIRVDNFDVALMRDGSGGQSGSREDFSDPRQPHWTRNTVPESPSTEGSREEAGKIVARRLANGQFDVVI